MDHARGVKIDTVPKGAEVPGDTNECGLRYYFPPNHTQARVGKCVWLCREMRQYLDEQASSTSGLVSAGSVGLDKQIELSFTSMHTSSASSKYWAGQARKAFIATQAPRSCPRQRSVIPAGATATSSDLESSAESEADGGSCLVALQKVPKRVRNSLS